ncbi:ATP-dependent (S)-NAD(P)H-hydrate dehydratase isoform X1 [Exaiptasia diaphana]|uniref:ATP-dependent (S)-NAD(P)H-hydrate dehydratase n=1 Tax=Exaiptasia diaphana TaxID=2652724 RepID=A0A913WW43_EXADI|nr:ATP-dependent (S)-NAD(P)H-hydrate dehydratase isoform X1 [Exaiptasia diaphana]
MAEKDRCLGVVGRSVRSDSFHQQSVQLLDAVKKTIPPLVENSHKGESGRVGVIGGSQEYTGAPYFAAISALKTGADLSHVFCPADAATVIKSYSPELIVHPLLDRKHAVNEVSEWLTRLHSLVVGPGLGRNPAIIDNAKALIEKARKQGKHLVIDADGLFIVTTYPDLIRNYTRVILTPNAVEFARLYSAVMGQSSEQGGDLQTQVVNLSKTLGHVTICRKGQVDIISDGRTVVLGATPGSNRRCGGQGDLLAGSMGTFVYWAHYSLEKSRNEDKISDYSSTIIAAYAASTLTRTCSNLAFPKHGRSMTTTDMIDEIHFAFEKLFGSP